MSVYHIERGGHADMKRIYPMMTFDFKDWERPTQLECQGALLRGAELLLLKDAQNAECGYALMLKNRVTGYVLLGWLAVYPHLRGAGTGREFLQLIRSDMRGCRAFCSRSRSIRSWRRRGSCTPSMNAMATRT